LFLYLTFFSLLWTADALAVANARISSLEAELEASRKAWDAATVAKTTPEKSSKLALARAKKAEKALSDANKEHIQREQVMTEQLNKMSALAGGKYHAFPSLLGCLFLCLLMCAFSSVFVSLVLQNILGCLHHLCSQTMILSWL
jgi:hypothetical protein